jgi:nitroimidazol reductase NimA-like FMN-containing flavoprotein (pyridoxamine 5'-phosphate oxidase superfamily)
MVIEEMTDRECRAMLSRTNLARLACALSNQPYIVPIHVEFDDAFLYSFATLGQKIEWMRQNPLVCLEIDELTTDRQWASVVIFGVYEELPDTPEYEYPRRIAEGLFQRHPAWWEPASVPLAGHEQRSRVVFRILISRMSGRRAGPGAPETPFRLTHASDTPHARGLTDRLRRAWDRLRVPPSGLSPRAE